MLEGTLKITYNPSVVSSKNCSFINNKSPLPGCCLLPSLKKPLHHNTTECKCKHADLQKQASTKINWLNASAYIANTFAHLSDSREKF